MWSLAAQVSLPCLWIFSRVCTDYAGLVGGWIVHHLVMRGENPAAIRILDLSPTKRPEAIRHNIAFVKTDVSNLEQVNDAFAKQWPDQVADLPLTVFHCVALIAPNFRHEDFLGPFVKVNIEGTKNVLAAAKAAGADVLVSTSSGSVAYTPPTYWPLPWARSAPGLLQILANADRKSGRLDDPLSTFAGCYSWSKAQAELAITEANSPTFRTGAIRPANGIYGHGVNNSSSLTWNYIRRGGSPTWIANVVAHFVNAQNVSIGHLAYENALISGKSRGGKGYCVTDPNPPIIYGDLYFALTTLAHPTTPVKFPRVPHLLMLILAYILEAYDLIRARYLSFLPEMRGDLAMLRPSVFNVSAFAAIFTDDAAKSEIGYNPPINTLDGTLLALIDWNAKVEADMKAKLESGKVDQVEVREPSSVPKPPKIQ